MDRSMIDVAGEGALMDKIPVVARQLISNMAINDQQFSTRVVATSKASTTEVFVFMIANNQRLENKLTELKSLGRQLAIGQQQNMMAANQPRLCGIFRAPNHPTKSCSTLQEIEQATKVYVMQYRQPFKPQQQQYNPYSNTYNIGWRDHLNLRYGPGPQQQQQTQQQKPFRQ